MDLPYITGFRLSSNNRFYKRLYEETSSQNKDIAFKFIGDFRDKKDNIAFKTPEDVSETNDEEETDEEAEEETRQEEDIIIINKRGPFDIRSTYELIKAFQTKENTSSGHRLTLVNPVNNEENQIINATSATGYTRDTYRQIQEVQNQSKYANQLELIRYDFNTSHVSSISAQSSPPYVTSSSHVGSNENSPRDDLESDLKDISSFNYAESFDNGKNELCQQEVLDLENEENKFEHVLSRYIPQISSDLVKDSIATIGSDITPSVETKSEKDIMPSNIFGNNRISPNVSDLGSMMLSQKHDEITINNQKDVMFEQSQMENIKSVISHSNHNTPRYFNRKDSLTKKFIGFVEETNAEEFKKPKINFNNDTKIVETGPDLAAKISAYRSGGPSDMPKKFCVMCKLQIRLHEQYLHGEKVMHRHCLKCIECQAPLYMLEKREVYSDTYCLACFNRYYSDKNQLWMAKLL